MEMEKEVELLVDTSISPYCLQCLDGSGMGDTDAVWFERGGVTSDLPSDVEVVNGVLVLLDPMGLIRPGRRGYTVTCQSGVGGSFRYDIKLLSTSKIDLLSCITTDCTSHSPPPTCGQLCSPGGP